MRLGVILSSGGAAFEQMAKIVGSDVQFEVVTDRPCGAETVASNLRIPVKRIISDSSKIFSSQAADHLGSRDCTAVLLFFDRLVSAELYEKIPTFNIHPAALPAFKGLNAIDSAKKYGVRILGCTLHIVDNTVDGGPIVSQIARSVDPSWDSRVWQNTGFLLKVYCGLVWLSLLMELETGSAPLNASHALPDVWTSQFQDLQREFDLSVI